MTKIMFQVISFGFKHIIVFVFYFPSGTAIINDRHNIFWRNIEVGGKLILVYDFATAFISANKLTPIHFQGIFTVT